MDFSTINQLIAHLARDVTYFRILSEMKRKRNEKFVIDDDDDFDSEDIEPLNIKDYEVDEAEEEKSNSKKKVTSVITRS